MPQALLDATPAAIDGRVAAERPGQAGTAGLEQDRGHERNAHEQLADGQDGIHEEDVSDLGPAADATTGRASARSGGLRDGQLRTEQ